MSVSVSALICTCDDLGLCLCLSVLVNLQYCMKLLASVAMATVCISPGNFGEVFKGTVNGSLVALKSVRGPYLYVHSSIILKLRFTCD